MGEEEHHQLLKGQDSFNNNLDHQNELFRRDSSTFSWVGQFKRHRHLCFAALYHVTVFVLLGLLWAVLGHFHGRDKAYGVNLIRNESKGPAVGAVEYVRTLIDNNLEIENVYKGDPRPELDQAWGELLQYRNAAVHPSELDGEESVTINDGSGRVLVNLNVFHSLHCLNSVRKYLYRSQYNATYTKTELEGQLDHLSHCIDVIRRSLICNGDVAIITYDWREGHPLPWPNFKVQHECKNWDKILEWSKEHSAPRLRGQLLLHPIFGPVYPDM